MSITTTMSKTPGARQHNRGWMKMLREERRVEAAERQAAYLVEHRMLLTPREVIQLETALDDA